MKFCPACKTTKSRSLFGFNANKKDGLQSTCKSCRVEYVRGWYLKNKKLHMKRVFLWNKKRHREIRDFIFNYFKHHPCVDCGESDPIVLEFDHVNGKKDFNISDASHCSQQKLEKEMEKCEVRCCNCHRRITCLRRLARGRSVRLDRLVHTREAEGSNPSPATILLPDTINSGNTPKARRKFPSKFLAT